MKEFFLKYISFFLLLFISTSLLSQPREFEYQNDITYCQIGKEPWTKDEYREALEEFEKFNRGRPLAFNTHGMKSPHMFYCWFVVKKLKPKYIIESGVCEGQSTWLFEHAAPDAKIISIDPDLEMRRYISPKVTYLTTDFSEVNWDQYIDDRSSTLCFFDDHQGSFRLEQCFALGFKHVLYEDNYPVKGGNYHPESLSVKAALYHEDLSKKLKEIIELYNEFPPIYPNLTQRRFNYQKWSNYSKRPLFTNLDHPDLQIFVQEAPYYTWLAYIKLKDFPNA